jgi:hypothetical protein
LTLRATREHPIEDAAFVEGAKISEATDRLTADEDLRDGRPSRGFDEPSPQLRVAVDVDLFELDALAAKKSQRGAAVAAPVGRVDLYVR